MSLKLNRQDIILKIIRENPGIHVRGLIDLTGLENGVITHHLDKLEKQGRVNSRKYSRYKRYYSLDVAEEEFEIIRNLRKPTKKKILFYIIVQGSPTFKEIVSKVNKSPATVSWNLSEMIRNNVIEKQKINSKIGYKISDIEILKRTFRKEFPLLLDEKNEHSEDIFLAL